MGHSPLVKWQPMKKFIAWDFTILNPEIDFKFSNIGNKSNAQNLYCTFAALVWHLEGGSFSSVGLSSVSLLLTVQAFKSSLIGPTFFCFRHVQSAHLRCAR